MRTSNTTQEKLLKLVLLYKVLCFIITLVLLGYMHDALISPFFLHNFWYLVFLFMGLVLYIPLFRSMYTLLSLAVLEYFAVLLYAYFEPHILFMEFLWIPGILMEIALILKPPASIAAVLVLGIPGSIFFSYATQASTAILVSVQEREYPLSILILLFYVPVTALIITISVLRVKTQKLNTTAESLEAVNQQLEKMNQSITSKMFRLENDSTMEERRRISKEIHDTAGYVFTNVIMMLQAASAILYKDTDKAAGIIMDARDCSERGVNEIRHILRNIRDNGPSRLSLQNEIHDTGRSFQKATGTSVTIDYGNWPKTLSPKLDSFFISFIQEALTNAVKHGNSTAINIQCWRTDTDISMKITDNGKGAELPIERGIGIASIEDYIRQVSGTVRIRNHGLGFEISVIIPLSAIDSEESPKE
ncbi:sensor histidine kinase [Breznakiella homolactica]|uniref:histidine kinase n=1 Tax=Breznakiella homolactica TaxID=2798577 RepID=A0A7T7XQM4_9SPIR|nr:histidine kinase [Breznakiella homolactica]QQO10695.1 hypothetical protein JFL75_07220 [Breznakiella homolactica]